MVFASYHAFIFPLEESGEVKHIDRRVCTGVPSAGGDVGLYHSRREQRRAVVHKAASHKTEHRQTSSESFLCMKNYHLNPQTTLCVIQGINKAGTRKIITFSPLKPIHIFRSHRLYGKGRDFAITMEIRC